MQPLPQLPVLRAAFGWLTWLIVAAVLAAPLVLTGDSRSALLMANTLFLAAGAIAWSLPVGLLLGWLGTRTPIPGRFPGLFLLVFGAGMPLYLQVAAWDAAFGLQGWATLGWWPSGREPLLAGMRGAIWLHGVAAIPWVALLSGLSLLAWPEDDEQQARLDAGAWRVFLHIAGPKVWIAATVAAVWVLLTAAGEIAATDLYRVRSYAEELYMGFALGDDPAEAPLRAIPGVLFVAGLAGAGLLAAGRLAAAAPRAASREGGTPRPRTSHYVLAAFVLVLLGIPAVAPLVSLTVTAGTRVERMEGETTRRWSAGHAMQMVTEGALDPAHTLVPAPRTEFLWTFLLGGMAAATSVGVTMPLAWWGRRGRFRSALLLVGAAVLFAVPGPLFGLALLASTYGTGLPWLEQIASRSILLPWLALTLRAIPLVLLLLWTACRTLETETLEQGRLDGLGRCSLPLRLAIPQRRNWIAASLLAAFAIAIGDLATVVLVIPPGVTLVSQKIAQLVHYGVDDRLGGLSLAAALLLAPIAACLILLLHRRRD